MILTYFPKRILLVGATGFTGERVARRLRRSDVQVVTITRDPEAPIAQALRADGCDVRDGDCNRRWTVWEALESCDAVISCAQIGFAPVLMQACSRMGVKRLICLSSTRKMSRVRDATVDEVTRGELAVSQSELDWTILRPTMIFGGARDRNLYPIMEWMRKRPWFPVFGEGTASVQPVFVEDVAQAVLDALRRPDTIGKAYTLAGPEPLAWNNALLEMARACDREVRLLHIPVNTSIALARLGGPITRKRGFTREAVLRLQEERAFSIDEAREALGFAPRDFATAINLVATGESEADAIYGPSGSRVVEKQ